MYIHFKDNLLLSLANTAQFGLCVPHDLIHPAQSLDKERIITPAPFVMNILKRIYEEQNTLQKKEYYNNSMNLVFVNESGEHLVERTVLRRLKCIVKKMGHPEIRFHDLRHTFATIALQIGDDIKTVSATLGHATTSFTMDVYGHVSNTMRQESANRMETFITNIKAD